MKTVLRALIRFYQLAISPMLGPRCRYYPSCSNYALQAIQLHGPLRGTALAGWRLLRCNPWSPGGVDFPPPRRGSRGASDEPEAQVRAGSEHGHEHGHEHGLEHAHDNQHAHEHDQPVGESRPGSAAYGDESSHSPRSSDGSTDRRTTRQGV